MAVDAPSVCSGIPPPRMIPAACCEKGARGFSSARLHGVCIVTLSETTEVWQRSPKSVLTPLRLRPGDQTHLEGVMNVAMVRDDADRVRVLAGGFATQSTAVLEHTVILGLHALHGNGPAVAD